MLYIIFISMYAYFGIDSTCKSTLFWHVQLLITQKNCMKCRCHRLSGFRDLYWVNLSHTPSHL